MTGKQMIKKYKKAGWKVARITGSHYVLENKGNREIIPHHTKELKKGHQIYYLKRLEEVN